MCKNEPSNNGKVLKSDNFYIPKNSIHKPPRRSDLPVKPDIQTKSDSANQNPQNQGNNGSSEKKK